MKIREMLAVSYTLTAILPLLAAVMVIYLVSARSLDESAKDFADLFNSQVVSNIDSFFNDYDRLTKSALVDSEAISQLGMGGQPTISQQVSLQMELRRTLLRLLTAKPEIVSACILTEDGQLFATDNTGDSLSAAAIAAQPWLAAFRQSGETLRITAVHGRAYADRNQDRIVLSFVRKILSNRGGAVGYLILDLEPSALVRLSDRFLYTRNQYNIKISVTNEENELIYDSDVASGRIAWSEVAAAKDNILYEKNSGDYMLMTSQTARGGFKANSLIPKSGLLFKISRVGYAAVAAVFACTLVIVAVSLLISRSITRPIRRLQANMKEVEKGNYRFMETDGEQSASGKREAGGNEIASLLRSYNHMVQKIRTLVEEVLVATIRQKDAQYLALQAQINPHMLYNTLESIRMKALVSGEEEIAEMIKILARMFRLSLDGNAGQHQIRDEVEYARNYLKLQNIRYRDVFSLDAALGEEILDASIIALVFQPLIENSVKYGTRGQGRPLHMRIWGEVTREGDIRLWLSDDGAGMAPETMDRANRALESLRPTGGLGKPGDAGDAENKNGGKGEDAGEGRDGCKGRDEGESRDEGEYKGEDGGAGKDSIGLKNIAQRLMLYYGAGYCLRIQKSDGAGTVIELKIPLGKAGSGREIFRGDCG
jgi:two-component system sensor histidine kinase YesM